MRVLILSHLFPSQIKPYYGNFVYEQVDQLQKKGVELVVLSPVKYAPFPLALFSKKWKDYHSIPLESKWRGIQVYYPRYPILPKNILFYKSGEWMYKSIRRLAIKLHSKKPFDLIHAHVALPDGFAAKLLSKELNIPYVLTIHGQDLQKTIHYNHNCKKRVMSTIQSAESTILVSQKLKRILDNEHDRELHNVVIIPNGVNDRFLIKDPIAKRKPLFFKTEGPKILSVSNLYFEKGIQDNILAIRNLVMKYPDLEYLIVGDGPEKEKLKKMVLELDLSKYIRFLGAFKPEDVKTVMEECDLFSMPSFNEAFGIVYIEAMALGKPIIGCRGEGPEDYIINGVNGFLVEPRNIQQLEKAIEEIILGDNRIRAMGENAKALVINKYTWRKAAEQIIDVYSNLVN